MRRPISRYVLTALILLGMMCALIYKFATITLVDGDSLLQEAENRSQSVLSIKGTRGRILDRNGVVLAYSKTSYNVQFMRDPDNRADYDSAVYTEAIYRAIQIIEAGGCKTIDTCYIKMDESGELYFDFGVKSESGIKARYKNFCDAIGVSIKDDLTKPSEQWDLSKWPTAEYCYNYLRKYWFIPAEMGFEDAAKIISVRQEVVLNNYRAYEPITIAYDVGMDIVAQIEMNRDALPGIQTAQSTTRVYPHGTTAAHVIGYLSPNVSASVTAAYLESLGYTPEEYAEAVLLNENGETVRDEHGNALYSMLKLGYAYNDFIGMSGVESTMEAYLSGSTNVHQGSIVVEVNKNGSVIRQISSTPATDGDDIMLTIDIDLQRVTDSALEKLINVIKEKEDGLIFEDEDGEYAEATNGNTTTIKTAKTGAIVVMDINTGAVLAMSSYPSYDPNWFINGLSDEQADILFGESAADTTPMRNKAISSKLAPGSIFKMVTGIGGISEGVISLTDYIDCEGAYYVTNTDGSLVTTNAPKCWQSNTSKHAHQTIIEAIKNSCNYYFFTLSERMGIEKLDKWASAFGLTSPTGIELTGEAVGIIGGQSVLFDNTILDETQTLSISSQKTSLPSLIYKRLCEKLTEYMNSYAPMQEIDEEAIERCALRIMLLQDGNLTGKGPQIRSILSEELGLPEGVTSVQNWVNEITSYLNELQWKPSQTIRTGIGQGVSLVTPVAVARYVAAVANQGTVYNARVVDRILQSNGATVRQFEPEVFNRLEVSEEVWTAVREGMREVVSPEDQGTAAGSFSSAFKALGYQDKLSGKTGTAQVGSNTIDIENTSWFVSYAPSDKPEIAVVVCVPNGYSGSSSVSGVEQIFTYYFGKQDSAAPETLVSINEIAP